MRNKILNLIIISLLLSIGLNFTAMAQWRDLRYMGRSNPAQSLMGFGNTLDPIREYGGVVEGTFTPGFGYRFLSPSNLTFYKGKLITLSDKVQYSRGSLLGGDGSGVVFENFNPNQGTLEFWVRPNWNAGGYNGRIIMISDGTNKFQLYTTSDGRWYFQLNNLAGFSYISSAIQTFVAGSWNHIVGVWDFNNTVVGSSYYQLYVNSSVTDNFFSSATTKRTQSGVGTIYIGQLDNNTIQFNGVIAGRILSRPLSLTEVTTLYAGGAGHTDTFMVTPDTVWMGGYSNDSNNAVYWHRGQQVIATTTTNVTVAEAVGLRSWNDNDRITLWDGCGYKVQGWINGTPSSTNIPIDDGVGGALTNADKVGVGATLNGSTQYFSRADNAGLSITGDMTIQGWTKTSSGTTQTIISKWNHTDNKRSYLFRISVNVLEFIISDDGTNNEVKTGTIVVSDGKWHFVAAVYDATAETVGFYVDGYLDRQQTFTTETGALNDNDSELRIGVSGGTATAFFSGSLRNIQLFNDKRTPAEILTDATNPLADNTGNANQVSQWNLVDATSVVNPIDSNANANHLTLNGGTTTNYGTHSRTQTALISKNLIADGRMGNGGIGGWTVGGTTTLAKSTSVIRFDERVLRITNGAAAQSYTRQTLTTVAGEDYFFHGWYNSPVTPNGTSQLVDIDAIAALGVTVTQAGAIISGNWYEVYSCFEAADNSTTIDLGSGSITNGEIGRWDNVKIHKSLVDNGGMEGIKQGTDPYFPAGNWSLTGSPSAGEVDVINGALHTGALGVQLINADLNEGIQQNITLIFGKYYTFGGWAKNNTQNINIILSDATARTLNVSNANVWTNYRYTFKADTANLNVKIVSNATDQTGNFDNFSVVEIDQTVASTATPTSLASSYPTGKWGSAAQSIRVDGGDTLIYPNATNFNTRVGSVSFWGNIQAPYNNGDTLCLFDNRGANDANRLRLYYNPITDKFIYDVNGSVVVQSSAQIDNTNFYSWHLFTITWDFPHQMFEFYIDKTLIGRTNSALSQPTLSTNFYIGSNYNSSNQADIIVDDFFTFEQVISGKDISRLYGLPSPASYRELLRGWW